MIEQMVYSVSSRLLKHNVHKLTCFAVVIRQQQTLINTVTRTVSGWFHLSHITTTSGITCTGCLYRRMWVSRSIHWFIRHSMILLYGISLTWLIHRHLSPKEKECTALQSCPWFYRDTALCLQSMHLLLPEHSSAAVCRGYPNTYWVL